MKQRTALFLAAAVTSFVLVAVGSVAGRVMRAAAAPAPASAPTGDALSVVQQREAAYRQLIDEANTRLQQAYQQQATAGQAAQTQEQSYAISPDMAAQIASTLVPGAGLVKPPELVNFQGAVAYEVVLSSGKVYVDATTGRVLFNGAAQTLTTAQIGGNAGWGDDDAQEEHEGWDD